MKPKALKLTPGQRFWLMQLTNPKGLRHGEVPIRTLQALYKRKLVRTHPETWAWMLTQIGQLEAEKIAKSGRKVLLPKVSRGKPSPRKPRTKPVRHQQGDLWSGSSM
jgi:hypothetical protein